MFYRQSLHAFLFFFQRDWQDQRPQTATPGDFRVVGVHHHFFEKGRGLFRPLLGDALRPLVNHGHHVAGLDVVHESRYNVVSVKDSVHRAEYLPVPRENQARRVDLRHDQHIHFLLR